MYVLLKHFSFSKVAGSLNTVDVDWIHLAEDRVQQAAFCEHGNEPAIEY
jgi:hypothetical protein